MKYRTPLGLLLCLLFLVIFMYMLGAAVIVLPPSLPATTAVGEALWKGRTFEVILQGIMILSGVMSVILLIGSRRSRERMP
jgi:hypothetical protein